MAVRVIFSDLHFGDPLCSLRRKLVTQGLRSFLQGLGRIDEVILAGDILDANISSLTKAIEGLKGTGVWPKQIGFRTWLSYLLEDGGLNVGRIVYIPGNHDYIIWNILSTDKAFVQPISQGKVPTDLPLFEATFSQPFIRGIAPQRMRDKFEVIYPDYDFTLAGRSVLVTHGHYLDEQQTLLKNLQKLVEKEGGNEAKAVRRFFIGTAQYQAAANAVSYMNWTRVPVDEIHKKLGALIGFIGKLRNKPINTKMLKAIEMYLRYFRRKSPDVFIFGHTHKPGRRSTKTLGEGRLIKKEIDVWNDGSFVEDKIAGIAGSFIVTNDNPESGETVKLYVVDLKGNVREKSI